MNRRNGYLGRSAFIFILLGMMMVILLLLVQSVDADDRTIISRSNGGKQDSGELVQLSSFFRDIFQAKPNDRQRAIGALIGRTFGAKRVQFMLMPMVYKMGVMMTMLGFLTLISLKGLTVGLVLLVLKLSAIFGKLYTSHPGHSPVWTPPQPVHVHLHNDGHHSSQPAYSGWESAHGPPGPPDESYYYKG